MTTAHANTKNEPAEFCAKDYWESRLSKKYSLAGVGDIRMPLSYNKILYRLRGIAFSRALRRVGGRPKSVLDIGSGSGFYIEKWKSVAASVAGADITETAVVELARRHPGCRFERWDAGAEACPFDETFDAVSAFDVFFHIVDNERYGQAISNVSSVLKDGGLFLYSDYFMLGPEKRQEHIVFRSKDTIADVMRANGLTEIARLPVFYMMNSPVVTSSRLPRAGFNLMLRFAGRSEFCGTVFGWMAYPFERLMTSLIRQGTGTDLVVYRKGRAD